MRICSKITKLKADFNVKSHRGRQVLATIPSCLISICSGMTFGITAVMLPQLREDKDIYYVSSHESWIASVSTLSMVVGSLTSGFILDNYGRKTAHVILGIPYFIGWITIAGAPSTAIIILGRFFIGLSTGANKSVMFCYIGELASPTIRTFAMFVPSILTNVGILISHIFTYYMGWKTSSYICIVPAILISGTSLFLKESPLWLISKGRMEEGVEIFRWFRGTDDASETELKTVLEKQSDKVKMSAKEKLKVVCSSAFIKPMLTLLVVVVNIYLSGFSIISFYSLDIFRLTFSGNLDPFTIMVVMDCVVGTVSASICFLGKYMSKRKSYLISNFGVSLCIAGLIACLFVGYEGFIWLPVACLIIYFCFSASISIIGWTFVPELLPNSTRGLGSGINSTLACIILFIIVKMTPDFMNVYGIEALFSLYGISTFIFGIILFFILPDTDGKTLQSIEDSYNKNKVESTSI